MKDKIIPTRFGKVIIKENKNRYYDEIEVWTHIPDKYGGGFSMDGTIIIHDESIGGENEKD